MTSFCHFQLVAVWSPLFVCCQCACLSVTALSPCPNIFVKLKLTLDIHHEILAAYNFSSQTEKGQNTRIARNLFLSALWLHAYLTDSFLVWHGYNPYVDVLHPISKSKDQMSILYGSFEFIVVSTLWLHAYFHSLARWRDYYISRPTCLPINVLFLCCARCYTLFVVIFYM